MPAHDRKKLLANIKKPMSKSEALQKKFVASGKDLQSLLKEAKKLSKK